ncbi:MAG: hypothetical protein WCP95_01200 [Actinomycetes bacterium]
MIALVAVATALALAGCSSATSTLAASSPAASATSSPSAGPSSTAPTAAPSAAASGASGWMGDALARAAMPKKEDIQTVVGAAVTKDPDIASYADKDLRLTSSADPASCTEVYALVWALTVPKDTRTFTGASYTIGNSALVVSIADSGLSLAQAKAAIDKCARFSVQRTADSTKYTVGDSLSQFTTKADLVSPDHLAVAIDSTTQVLTNTSSECVGGATIAPSCLQSQSDQVNQVLRRVGPNLISVWGLTTTAVAGSTPADTPITLPEVTAVADGVQSMVTELTK